MSRYPTTYQMSPWTVGLLAVCWLVILIPVGIWGIVQTIELKINGLPAQGIVLETKGSGKNRHNVVQFHIDGQPITFSSPASDDVGDRVTVLYLPTNPKGTAKVDSWGLIITPLLLALVAFVLMPVFLIDSWKKRNRN